MMTAGAAGVLSIGHAATPAPAPALGALARLAGPLVVLVPLAARAFLSA